MRALARHAPLVCAGAACAAVCALALAGCGSGSGGAGVGANAGASEAGHAATEPTTVSHGALAPASAPALPYRWLVATTGAPASIAVENRATGTTAWRLPGPSDEIGGAAH